MDQWVNACRENRRRFGGEWYVVDSSWGRSEGAASKSITRESALTLQNTFPLGGAKVFPGRLHTARESAQQVFVRFDATERSWCVDRRELRET